MLEWREKGGKERRNGVGGYGEKKRLRNRNRGAEEKGKRERECERERLIAHRRLRADRNADRVLWHGAR